jgi:hypothetical protein
LASTASIAVVAGLEEAEALYRPIIDNRGPLDVEAASEQVTAR